MTTFSEYVPGVTPVFTAYVIAMGIPPTTSSQVYIIDNAIGMERIEPAPGSTHAVRIWQTTGWSDYYHQAQIIVTRESPL